MSPTPAFQTLPVGASHRELTESAAGGLYAPTHEHDACGVGFVAVFAANPDMS